jgi:hypothetical protein
MGLGFLVPWWPILLVGGLAFLATLLSVYPAARGASRSPGLGPEVRVSQNPSLSFFPAYLNAFPGHSWNTMLDRIPLQRLTMGCTSSAPGKATA